MAKKNINPRIRIPKQVKKGDIFEVKTLVTHSMETGLRKDKETGKIIPRDILKSLTVTYDGAEVLRTVWHPSLSANPYTSFHVLAGESGPMTFVWVDDAGETYKVDKKVTVQG